MGGRFRGCENRLSDGLVVPGRESVFDSQVEEARLVAGSSSGLATRIDFGNSPGPWASIHCERRARGEIT